MYYVLSVSQLLALLQIPPYLHLLHPLLRTLHQILSSLYHSLRIQQLLKPQYLGRKHQQHSLHLRCMLRQPMIVSLKQLQFPRPL